MGLVVSVMRDGDGYDCTNNGFSKTFNNVLVTNVDGPVEGHDMPRARLVPGNLPGTVKLVSEAVATSGQHTMFGGNFAYTSDSRWNRAVEEIAGSRQSGAVPIHDRIEA